MDNLLIVVVISTINTIIARLTRASTSTHPKFLIKKIEYKTQANPPSAVAISSKTKIVWDFFMSDYSIYSTFKNLPENLRQKPSLFFVSAISIIMQPLR